MSKATISDPVARVIAAKWQNGSGSALYALASSGAIQSRQVLAEIDWNIGLMMYNLQNQRDLEALAAYVDARGDRGPVDGWSKLGALESADV